MEEKTFDEWCMSCLPDSVTRVVDIGCGYPARGAKNIGHTVVSLVDAGYDAYGVDINENVTKLNTKFKYTDPERFVCSDMIEYLTANKKWDAVLAAYSFDDIDDSKMSELYKTVYKSLNKRGRFIVEYFFDEFSFDPIYTALNKAGFKLITRYPAATKNGKIAAHRFVATKR